VPYRVDLTPFAGVLADGGTHTVAVSVYNANGYFLATANLLVYTDHGTGQVTGGLMSNTLSAAPTPTVTENIATSAGPTYTGTVDTSSAREFSIRGWVNTSHGRVETTVTQKVGFTNNQVFDVGPTIDEQNVQQLSTVDSTSVTKQGWSETRAEQHFRYPLTINFSYVVNSDGSVDQTTSVQQAYDRHEKTSLNGWPVYESSVHNEVKATDTLPFDASGNLLGPMGSKTSQTYTWKDSLGACYSRTIKAAAQVLTSVEDGKDCGGWSW
jgi:Peptide N-acetyl-beta-D-glucosaminyl asparaginase amidase A